MPAGDAATHQLPLPLLPLWPGCAPQMRSPVLSRLSLGHGVAQRPSLLLVSCTISCGWLSLYSAGSTEPPLHWLSTNILRSHNRQACSLLTVLLHKPDLSTAVCWHQTEVPRHASQQILLAPGLLLKRLQQLQSPIAGGRCAGTSLSPASPQAESSPCSATPLQPAVQRAGSSLLLSEAALAGCPCPAGTPA